MAYVKIGNIRGLTDGDIATFLAARNDVDAMDTRLTAVEILGGLAPGDVSDATAASLIGTQGTQTRASLDTAIADGTAPVVESLGTLVAQEVPKVAQVPAVLGLTIPINIIRTRSGFITNMDPSKRHTKRVGPTYYVDPASGLNTNDGLTESTAFKTPFYASQKNASDWAEIVVTKSATFDRAEGVFLMQKGGTFRTLPGVKATIICGDRLTEWTASGAAWQATIASCNGVFDDGYKDAYGDPTPLKLATSIAEVQATAGTYYFAAGIVYVRTHDSRTPDANVYIGRPVSCTGWHANATGDNVSVYLEGVHWWGGTATANFTARGNGWRVLAKDCGFHAAGSTNGYNAWGLAESVLVGCSANHNYLDGFNYTDNAGRTGQFIEVDCRARGNGRAGGSNNGSTSHDNYRGIRVGGEYYGNEGANVADVGTAKTYNVGCVAGGSTDYKQDFYTNSEMWLDGCLASSENGVVAFETGIIHVRETAASGAVTGNVTAY